MSVIGRSLVSISTTVRKLRQMSVGTNDSGYFLLPPRGWMEAAEKKEGKRILHFAVKTQEDTLLLVPLFANAKVETQKNSSPETVLKILKQGTLTSKLREVHKGKNIYRIVKIPRAWVHAKERQRNRKMSALRVTANPLTLEVEPIFGDRLKER